MRVGFICRLAGIVSTLSISLALLGCAGAGNRLNVDFKTEKNPPRGYLVYCSRAPGLCGDQRNELVWLTKARWDELVKVNDSINMKNAPETDERGFGLVDYWTVAEGAGDCEDLALAKRAELIKRGWPKSALLLAVADTGGTNARGAPAGPERHVVLLAFTDKGTYVLDNLARDIVDWSKASYHWTAVESPNNPLAWQGVKRAAR
jgi:predicted transglutaminase-like cysteine proteinase